jgi:hypothetical protein
LLMSSLMLLLEVDGAGEELTPGKDVGDILIALQGSNWDSNVRIVKALLY